MIERDEYVPEERQADAEMYDAAPPNMPPSPAGADVEIGGEAASSRRRAGLPPRLADHPEHQAGRPTPGREPLLGFDGLDTDDLLEWIDEADPDPALLRSILDYEVNHRNREPVLEDCRRRLNRLERDGPRGRA